MKQKTGSKSFVMEGISNMESTVPITAMKKGGGVSLVFSKTNFLKKLQTSSLISDNKESNNEEPDFVSALEDKKVHSSKGESEESKEYVIPLIKKNLWKKQFDDKSKKTSENKTEPLDSLESLAAQEIVAESAKQNEAWNDRGIEDTTLAIPLLMQNKIPDGFETDDKLDVSLRPEAPADASYDEIPIEHFGKAMLRGMGWKEGEGIGKNKKMVSTIDAVIRPKGMGLGADKSMVQQLNQSKQGRRQNNDEEMLVMKKGSFCLVEKGSSKGLYGTIESVDEDNARLLVKLSINGNTITVSQYNMRLVNKKEFEKYSKYINKAKVDEYKAEEEKKKQEKERHQLSTSSSSSSSSSRNGSSGYGGHHQTSNKRNSERSDHYDRNHKKHKTEHNNQSNRSGSVIWLRPQIRVRIISNSYKKGKYYKEKVSVEDILSVDNCVCKTESGKVLEGLSQQMLETVIPRTEPGVVMILNGKYKGVIAEVLKKDKSKCVATLQLLTDRDVILKLDYDDISEYVGDIRDEY